jgi:hypothetical protein
MVPTPGTNLAKISKLIETERTSGSFSHEDCQFFVSDFFEISKNWLVLSFEVFENTQN